MSAPSQGRGLFDDLPPVAEEPPPGQPPGGLKTTLTFTDVLPAGGRTLAPEPLISSPTRDQGSIFPYKQPERVGQAPQFDYSAGVLGSLLRFLTTPGDIVRGAIAPGSPEAYQRAAEGAGWMTTMSPAYRAGSRFGTLSPLGEPTRNPLASPDKALFGNMRGNYPSNLAKVEPPLPTTEAIQKDASRGYNIVRDSGWEQPSSVVGDALKNYRATPEAGRFDASTAPFTYTQIGKMENPDRSVTGINQLMNYRDALTEAIQKGEGGAARGLRDEVDKILAGAPGDLPATLTGARGNTRAFQGANRITGELNREVKGVIAEVDALTGQKANVNIPQQIRDKAAKILTDAKDTSRLLPDEQAALEAVRDGTWVRNRLRNFGDTYGAKDKIGMLMAAAKASGLGWLTGGAEGAVVAPLIAGPLGRVAKALEGTLTMRAVREAEKVTRRNSPLYQGLLADAPVSYQPGGLNLGRDRAILESVLPGLLSGPIPQNRLPPGYI